MTAGACAGGPAAPSSVPLGQEFSLRPGASATIEGTGLTVRFRTVMSDSRCPADVVCVHPGEAVVSLGADFPGGALTWQASTASPADVAVAGHFVSLVRLAPYPFSAAPIAPRDYRATLLVRSR